MRRAWRLAGAALAAVSLAAAGPAGAQMQLVETTIDLNYTYEQDHLAEDVTAKTGFQRKYQVKLETQITSSFDFLGAITVDLDNKWDTQAAATSRVSPSLELGIRGPQSAAKFTYQGTVDETEEFQEISGSTKYSNSANLQLELTPTYLPEIKFKLNEKRDYEEQSNDTSARTVELQLRHEFYDRLLTEFTLKLDTTVETLPERAVSDGVDWSWKLTYKERFFRDVEFEAAYEVKESYAEDSERGVFAGTQEDYSHTFKTRLRKSLELSPRVTARVSWDYTFEQDLLDLEYDYRVDNGYSLDVRWDVLPSLKVAGEAKRETELKTATTGGEDTSNVTDTLKAAFDYEPVKWLRFGGKAERKTEERVEVDTGGSLDSTEDRQYELTMKHTIGDYWALTAGASSSESRADGLKEDEEAKLRAELKLRILKLTWAEMLILPVYESSRRNEWDGPGDPVKQTFTGDATFKFELRSLVLDYIKLTITHEYGQKITEELDEVLNLTRTLDFDESTRFNAAVDTLWDDFRIEGEIERKATDTEDDPDPQIVEVLYSLKFDWEHDDLSLTSALKYRDKEEDDEIEFAAKLAWQGERFDVSGDYQLTKVYADEVDEQRKLNLKLSWKF